MRTPAFRRFGRDGRGVAVVEFAILAPIMVLLYVGMVELVQGLMAERRAAHAASAIGDLVAQTDEVTAAEVQQIFAISSVIMQPFDPDHIQLRVTSVRVDASGVPRVRWSDSNANWSERAVNSTVDIPEVTQSNGTEADFLGVGQSTVMAEVIYEYSSPFSEMFSNVRRWFDAGAEDHEGFTFESTFYLQPRQSDEVAYRT